MSDTSDLQKPPVDFAKGTIQQDIVEWGDQIAGVIKYVGVKIYDPTEDRDLRRTLVYGVEISDYIINDHVGETHRISHNYAKKDDEEGYPVFARHSQGALGQYLMNTELKLTKPADLVGKHVLFERRKIASLPGYKKNTQISAEVPRLYPVKVLS